MPIGMIAFLFSFLLRAIELVDLAHLVEEGTGDGGGLAILVPVQHQDLISGAGGNDRRVDLAELGEVGQVVGLLAVTIALLASLDGRLGSDLQKEHVVGVLELLRVQDREVRLPLAGRIFRDLGLRSLLDFRSATRAKLPSLWIDLLGEIAAGPRRFCGGWSRDVDNVAAVLVHQSEAEIPMDAAINDAKVALLGGLESFAVDGLALHQHSQLECKGVLLLVAQEKRQQLRDEGLGEKLARDAKSGHKLLQLGARR